MPKYVYMFCPLCNGIRPGIGSDEMTKNDVTCDICGEKITAKRVGNLGRHPADEKSRPFYMEESHTDTCWKDEN